MRTDIRIRDSLRDMIINSTSTKFVFNRSLFTAACHREDCEVNCDQIQIFYKVLGRACGKGGAVELEH